ncbi:hypothetical protein DSM100685_1823 [Bifidobacterium avesanii]|nr:hypothetical protein DSM100685_1823 [Bifidobacterium avesanii]
MAVLVIVGALMAYFGIWVPNRPANMSHLRVEVSESSKFTGAQMDDAVTLLRRQKRSYTGCAINRIYYDERWSNGRLDEERRAVKDDPGSGSSFASAIDRYGMGRVAIFRTDFTCGKNSADTGLGAGATTGWEDLLAWAPDDAKAERGWVWIDGGMG